MELNLPNVTSVDASKVLLMLLKKMLINFLILIFCELFIYGFIFLEILYFNLFSILVLFIIKFKIAVYKLKKSTKDEE